jgi:hypothetical protein
VIGSQRRQRLRIPSGWRDGLLFLTALGLLVNELVIRSGPERPTVLLLLGGLLGAPAFLRSDERRENDKPRAEPTEVEP